MEGQVARFIQRMAEQAVLWSAGCAIVLTGKPAAAAGFLLLGLVYARNLEFVHECLHAIAVPRGRANAVLGTLLAIPMLVSFSVWRREHMQHHRDVRIEGFKYDYARLTNLREYAVHILMLRHFRDACVRVVRGDPEYRPILTACFAVAVISISFHSWIPVLLWIAPLPFAAVIHTHIELPEHFGLEGISGGNPLRNARVIPAGRFVTWLVDGNNYHAIHHWQPRLAIARLPATYAALPPDSVEVSTYTSFYRDFFARLLHRHEPPRTRA